MLKQNRLLENDYNNFGWLVWKALRYVCLKATLRGFLFFFHNETIVVSTVNTSLSEELYLLRN